MDYHVFISKQALIIGYICSVIFAIGIQRTDAHICAIQFKKGVVPCFAAQGTLQQENVKNVNECCYDRRGSAFYTNRTGGKWDCLVCQELLAEHEWLPAPPCDKHNCEHTPQRYIWFTLPIPNRKIQCMGRSFNNVLHCKNNPNFCSSPVPTTDPVFCFKHRFRKFNSSSWGCPASSLDWQLARNFKECCSTRGRAAYAKHIDNWYIDEAKLHQCLPCPDNPSSDTMWSEWSLCASGSKCTRKRSMQIPYLENMPNHWCVETFTMEEPVSTNETRKHTKDKLHYILSIVGLLTSCILIVVLCFVCIRNKLQCRSKSSAEPSNRNMVIAKTNTDETDDGYLVPTKRYATPPVNPPPVNLPQQRALPEVYEQIYERISYYCSDDITAQSPPIQPPMRGTQ